MRLIKLKFIFDDRRIRRILGSLYFFMWSTNVFLNNLSSILWLLWCLWLINFCCYLIDRLEDFNERYQTGFWLGPCNKLWLIQLSILILINRTDLSHWFPVLLLIWVFKLVAWSFMIRIFLLILIFLIVLIQLQIFLFFFWGFFWFCFEL
jgi:hypothetical protein